jgi:hypothetical protein
MRPRSFTYFGDTFVWSPDSRAWRHVLTRGFPSYRAQASLLVDDATGKTYLFGGCVTTRLPAPRALADRAQGTSRLQARCIRALLTVPAPVHKCAVRAV